MNRAITRRSQSFSLRGLRSGLDSSSGNGTPENPLGRMGSRHRNREAALSQSSSGGDSGNQTGRRTFSTEQQLESIAEMSSDIASGNATSISAKEPPSERESKGKENGEDIK